ncbi:MAG: globin family protein [Cyanobacteria bacterium P01_H01_bin.105]
MPLNTELLTSSFDLLQARKLEFSDMFYQTLFADYPEVQPLFIHVDMEEQPKKLFASLVLVVNNLTKPDTLTNALKGLGTRHVKYGVIPSHYPMVGGTLIKTMATTLGDSWTPEVESAWIDAYSALTEIMLEGLEYPEETLTLAV